jgi:Cu/Ag efflux protein CusF
MKSSHAFFSVIVLLLFALSAGLVTACGGSESEPAADEERYQVDGYFIEVGMAGETITIIHEDIGEVMPSMRMRMLISSPDIADGFSRGDAARFEIVRISNSWYLEEMQPLSEEEAPQLSDELMQMR